MSITRKNSIVLDTSVLPRRPSVAEIKQFLDCELKLDMTLVKSIQPHNVKNVVFMAMHSEEVAARIAADHHLKHCMDCGGKRHPIPLPIYLDSSAVDVKVHDLPEEVENNSIISHMQQYGEVISIRNDVWRNYFPGISNGVRILRMKLTQPIPSYITISDQVTTTSYFGQQKSCKHCGSKDHPRLRCSEVAASTSNQKVNHQQSLPPSATKPIESQASSSLNTKQWPSLAKPEAVGKNNASKPHDKPDPKRQRSTDSDDSSTQAPKRVASPSTVSRQRDSSKVVSNTSTEIVGATGRYRRSSFSWIEDDAQRQELIEETNRRIEELLHQGF